MSSRWFQGITWLHLIFPLGELMITGYQVFDFLSNLDPTTSGVTQLPTPVVLALQLIFFKGRYPPFKKSLKMEINVLGPGCAKCQKPEEVAKEAVAESGVSADVEKSPML